MSDMDSKRDYNPVSPGVSFNVQIRRNEITKMIKKNHFNEYTNYFCKRDNVIQLVYDIKAVISCSEGTEEGPRRTIFYFSIYLTLWQVIGIHSSAVRLSVSIFHMYGLIPSVGAPQTSLQSEVLWHWPHWHSI